jgi:hypothetical protein
MEMECEHTGKFISPDMKRIVCQVHNKKEVNHQEYHKITGFGTHFNMLFNKLEMIFIDFQICLAIVEVFLKEEKALKIDFNILEKLQEDLDREMKNLNDWFIDGTFCSYQFLYFLFLKDQLWLVLLILHFASFSSSYSKVRHACNFYLSQRFTFKE